MSEQVTAPIEAQVRFRFLRWVTRLYARLGQVYFWIGTLMVGVRILTAVTTPHIHDGLRPWMLDAVLYFFFWPVMLIGYGLVGPTAPRP